MGCDCHACIEVLVEKDNATTEWVLYNQPSVRRDYRLFGAMAGVRSDECDQVAPVRGFPDDAAVMTRLAYGAWGEDAHTPSYLTHDEIDDLYVSAIAPNNSLINEYHPMTPYSVFGQSVWNFCRTIGYVPSCVKDIRLVFWFDS